MSAVNISANHRYIKADACTKYCVSRSHYMFIRLFPCWGGGGGGSAVITRHKAADWVTTVVTRFPAVFIPTAMAVIFIGKAEHLQPLLWS